MLLAVDHLECSTKGGGHLFLDEFVIGNCFPVTWFPGCAAIGTVQAIKRYVHVQQFVRREEGPVFALWGKRSDVAKPFTVFRLDVALVRAWCFRYRFCFSGGDRMGFHHVGFTHFLILSRYIGETSLFLTDTTITR